MRFFANRFVASRKGETDLLRKAFVSFNRNAAAVAVYIFRFLIASAQNGRIWVYIGNNEFKKSIFGGCGPIKIFSTNDLKNLSISYVVCSTSSSLQSASQSLWNALFSRKRKRTLSNIGIFNSLSLLLLPLLFTFVAAAWLIVFIGINSLLISSHLLFVNSITFGH